MTKMPGMAQCARAMLIVVGASCLLPVGWLVVAAATFRTGALGALIVGMLLLAAIPFAALAVFSFVLAVKFTHGDTKVRVGAVVVGWTTAVGSPFSIMAYHGVWGGEIPPEVWSAGVAMGALLALFATRESTRDWFDRQRPPASPGESPVVAE